MIIGPLSAGLECKFTSVSHVLGNLSQCLFLSDLQSINLETEHATTELAIGKISEDGICGRF